MRRCEGQLGIAAYKCLWWESRSLVLGLVTLHVEGEMVGAGEAAFTDLAAERLGTGVFSYVAGQLVGAGEAPLASCEVASVGFFTCMYSLVRLEMGALGVGLATHGEGAVVDAAFLQLRVVLAVVLDG